MRKPVTGLRAAGYREEFLMELGRLPEIQEGAGLLVEVREGGVAMVTHDGMTRITFSREFDRPEVFTLRVWTRDSKRGVSVLTPGEAAAMLPDILREMAVADIMRG